LIEQYNLISEGKQKRFAPGSLEDRDGAILLMRYIIGQELDWSEEDIKNKYDSKFFIRHKLQGMLRHAFGSSAYAALDAAYPHTFMPWELKSVPKGFWCMESAIKATKWLIEIKLGWSKEDVCSSLSTYTFRLHRLMGMLSVCFEDSPYKALEASYPGKYKPWELHSVSKSYWNEDSAKEAIRWIISEEFNWSRDRIRDNFNIKFLKEKGLAGMLCTCFENSPYKALEAVFPNEFLPWELKHSPKDMWCLETGIKATRWLIAEKLKWTREDVCEGLSQQTFINNGLRSMLQICFGNSPYKAIDSAYPNAYKPWEIGIVPRNFWSLETGCVALHWLYKEQLMWSYDQAKTMSTKQLFKEYRLHGMLQRAFKGSISLALTHVYSEQCE